MIANDIKLDILPKEAERIMQELSRSNMIIARSKNEFIYILEFDSKFHLFYHVPGSPSGGKKQFEKNEKYTAVIRNFANLADALFVVEFDKDFNLYDVMASAEDAILSAFPGDDRNADEDVEFIIRDQKSSSTNQEDSTMPKISTANTGELSTSVKRWLDAYPGDTVCAFQIWYEGMEGCGVPPQTVVETIEGILNGMENWKPLGKVRNERYGKQYSFRKK